MVKEKVKANLTFRNSFRRGGTRLSRQLLHLLGGHFIKAKSSERILEVLVVV